MASEVEHLPPQPDPSPATTTLKPQTSKPTTSGTESAAIPPLSTTDLRRPLFDDEDAPSDASASSSARDSASTSSRVVSPITSPPYWMVNNTSTHASANGSSGPNAPRHRRAASVESVVPAGAITLQDNEDGDSQTGNGNGYGRDRNRACWAKSVEVVNHVVVNSSATNIGAFVVWNIRVETLTGSYMNIRKRYSEFDDFRQRLVQTFPNFEAAVPALPPKSIISRFRPRFLEKRRAGLQYFLNCIMLNPEFSASPVLKDFLFS